MTEEQKQAIDDAALAVRCAVRRREDAAKVLKAADESYSIAAQEVTCARARYQAVCDQLTETQ